MKKKTTTCIHLHGVKEVGGFYITVDVSRFMPCKLGMLVMF